MTYSIVARDPQTAELGIAIGRKVLTPLLTSGTAA